MSAPAQRRAISIDDLEAGVVEGERAALGRAITLVESHRPADRELAQELLVRLLPRTGNSLRLGVSGTPGAGKSTFIEALGTNLTDDGHRVAVLAVDPSSGVSRGSILGDKTRMQQLSTDPKAFIRPSPSGGSLGGVAKKTRESILVCEAAGYDAIIVETVGVGQSEATVAGMVDWFLLLMLAGGGDELQGIKRGILELCDMIAINKADGDRADTAQRFRIETEKALRLLRGREGGAPKVMATSGLENRGVRELWAEVARRVGERRESGELEKLREQQNVDWTWNLVEETHLARLRENAAVASERATCEAAVRAGELTPALAAERILRRLD